MKNIKDWKPTVAILENGSLTVNEGYVGTRSYLVAQQSVALYGKSIGKHAHGTLLDLGCGTVPYYKIYKNKVGKIICIDWANSYHKNIHLDYTADLNEEVPLEDESVDTIILTDVLEHISKPHILMEEISRVLSKNGKLILGVPFMYWLHEEPFDYHRYTKYQLKELCKENNLKVLTIEEVGGALTVISDIIAKNLRSVFWAKIFQKSMLWFLRTKIGNKIDKRNIEKFPIGYHLVAQKV